MLGKILLHRGCTPSYALVDFDDVMIWDGFRLNPDWEIFLENLARNVCASNASADRRKSQQTSQFVQSHYIIPPSSYVCGKKEKTTVNSVPLYYPPLFLCLQKKERKTIVNWDTRHEMCEMWQWSWCLFNFNILIPGVISVRSLWKFSVFFVWHKIYNNTHSRISLCNNKKHSSELALQWFDDLATAFSHILL